MADSKCSAFTPTTSVTAITSIPVIQDGLNKLSNVGQLKTFIKTPVITTITAGIIPLTYDLVIIVGNCTLPVGIVSGTELKLLSSGAGKVTAIGLLSNDGYTFSTSGCTLNAVWYNSVWNIYSTVGMTSGIV